MTPTQPTATTTEVSEAMVERACRGYWPDHWPQHFADSDLASIRRHMRAALEAALSTAPSGDGVPGMVLVPRDFIEFVKSAPVNSGVCCCGDDMAGHPEPMSCGHEPVDQWHHSLSLWLDQINSASNEAR